MKTPKEIAKQLLVAWYDTRFDAAGRYDEFDPVARQRLEEEVETIMRERTQPQTEEPIQTEPPLAERTDIASDCVRECCNYVTKLQEFYVAALKAQNEQSSFFGDDWMFDDTESIIKDASVLTAGVAKFIERLVVVAE